MGLKVLILAARKTGYEAIKSILQTRIHTIVGVLIQEYENTAASGTDRREFENLFDERITTNDFATLLMHSGIPFWNSDKINSKAIVDIIKSLSPDVGLCIGWTKPINEPLISVPRLGFINFHTSDLPKYRGASSASWAILNGDEAIAVTAYKMLSESVYKGEIFRKQAIPIAPSMDIGELYANVESHLPEMIRELLSKLEVGTICPAKQDEKWTAYSYLRYPSDGWIDWMKPAREIDRLVRASSRPYHGAFTCWNMKKIIVWKGYLMPEPPVCHGVPGHIIEIDDNSHAKVITGEGIYVISEIQPEGNGPVAPGHFIKGEQQRLGLSNGEMFEVLNALLKNANL